MIKPPKLNLGATLGIICPSYYIDPKIYKKTSNIFIDKGFNIIEGKTISLKDNLFSGTPEERAKDIMDMFENPDVDAIVCARGGYGANRVLPLLDFDIIRKNPKVFIGYSDITAFLLSITQITGLVTFHGPMLSSYQDGLIEYNFKYFVDTLSGKSPITIEQSNGNEIRVLKNGHATGELWGGNLCLLVTRLGTEGRLNTDNIILFIEDTKEQHYRFDRMMYHLKESDAFENIKGLIIGELTEMKDTEPPFGRSTDEIIMDICEDLDIPIISNFPCGHGKYQVTLPISVPVRLDANMRNSSVTIIEAPVE